MLSLLPCRVSLSLLGFQPSDLNWFNYILESESQLPNWSMGTNGNLWVKATPVLKTFGSGSVLCSLA